MRDGTVLPRRPFFSCEEAAFSVVDGAAMRQSLLGEGLSPVVTLRVGPGNVFERPPRRVVERRADVVGVQCEGDTVVYLDFENGSARKRTPQGEFLYKGGLDEGNDGKGYIRAG